MATLSLSSSNSPKTPISRWPSTKPLPCNRKLVVSAKQGENEDKSVEESSVFYLRMHIKRVRPMEASKYRDEEAQMESSRETKVSSIDREVVFEIMELLLSYFAKNRASSAVLCVLMLAAMSLSLSQPELLAFVLRVAKELIAGCHVCIDIDI